MHWKLSKIKYPSTLKSNEILYKRTNKFCCFIINKYCRELTRQCVSHTTTHLQGMQGQRLSGGWSGILEVWNSANHSSAKYRKNIQIWFIHIRVLHSIQLQLKIYLQCIKSGCNCFEIHLYIYFNRRNIFLTNYMLMFYQCYNLHFHWIIHVDLTSLDFPFRAMMKILRISDTTFSLMATSAIFCPRQVVAYRTNVYIFNQHRHTAVYCDWP